MIKALLKFPFYLVWYGVLRWVLQALSLPFLIAAYILLSAVMGLSWVWERARYGDPKRYNSLGCD